MLRLPRFLGVRSRVEIDFPPSFSGKWTPVIKSDGAEIFGGNPSKGDEVVVGKCLNQMAHK